VNEVYVELDKTRWAEYEGHLKAMFAAWKAAGRLGVVEVGQLQQKLNTAKLDRAQEMIDEIVAAGRKVIFFSRYLGPLQTIVARYPGKAGLITGAQSLADRQKVIDGIQEGPLQVACMTLHERIAMGVNLTACDTVIFLDLDWVPATHAQAEDRAHRKGQTNTVQVFYLLAEGTVDTMLWEIREEKLRTTSTITDGTPLEQRAHRSLFSDFVRRLKREYREELADASDEVGDD
jgi:SNF2 family DNA or RNA helicase